MEKTTAIPLTQPFHIAPPATQTTAAAGVKTATKTSVSTHKTKAKPTAKTNMQLLGNVSPPAIRLPTQRSPRKQTALTAFYAIQPLHIIQSNRKAHNSKKRKLQKLSSTLPPFQQIPHTSMSSNPLSTGRDQPTIAINIPVPSQQQMTLMANSCGISTGQLAMALECLLQFQGFSFPLPNNAITPNSGSKRKNSGKTSGLNPIQVDGSDSDASSPAKRLFNNSLSKFTSSFNRGPNKWIADDDLLEVLKACYNFLPTTLNLNASRNKLTRLVTLASDILNADLTLTQVQAICDMDERTDPYTRFTTASNPSIMAVDTVSYASDLQMYNVMFGKQGSLYNNDTGLKPPKNSIIFMQVKGSVPNQVLGTSNIEHAIFLPDQLLLLTINDFVDSKDEGGNHRVRNAWQIREGFYTDITSTEELNEKTKICNQRIAGRIFGGGGNSLCTLMRAAVLYKTPTKG
jgi:hypothetical protein